MLRKSGSFTEYVKLHLENQMSTAIENYINAVDASALSLRLYKIKDIDEVELDRIDVKNVYVSDLPNSAIKFDIIVETTLYVYDSDRYHIDEPEDTSQWFLLECRGSLDRKLDDVEISKVCVYTNKNVQERELSDSLVPYISKEKLEYEAEQFLKRHYPEALLQPMYLDPIELTNRMGLTVLKHNIDKDTSVFGQIYFSETDAELYDFQTDTVINKHVTPGTIIVDPDVVFQRNLGAFNNTIVHECVHWDLHKKAFALEQLFNDEIRQIKCKVVGGTAGFSNEATKWMEWQANSLAPRIQMPLKMFTKKASELINRYRKEAGTNELCDIIQPVIEELAVFFQVSKLAAKLRMIDAGFDEARGAFIYIDGHYVKPFSYKKGAISDRETYSIPAKDAAIQFLINPLLQKANQYVYVDSHIVLNHPKFVYQNVDGETVMTDYARLHMDKCCLSFELSVKGGYNTDYHRECFLNRDKGTPVDFNIEFTGANGELDDTKRNALIKDLAMEEATVLNGLSNDYTAAWKEVLKWRGLSNAKLSQIITVSEKTIGNIINGNSEGTLNSVVLMCLGANLPYDISMYLIDRSGHRFKATNESHIMYRFVLRTMYTKSIKEIQDFLSEQGVAPL